MFTKQVNKKYRRLLKTLINSQTKSEILTGIRELHTLQINRCLKNFTQKRRNSNFDVNTLLFKNPFYREVMKEIILKDIHPSKESWEQRLTYWEPLFFQHNDCLVDQN